MSTHTVVRGGVKSWPILLFGMHCNERWTGMATHPLALCGLLYRVFPENLIGEEG